MSRALDMSLDDFARVSLDSAETIPMNAQCTVFAESEVINHLSQGTAPADIMHGAITSLVGRSVQLMKRVKAEPEFTLVGGILRFETFGDPLDLWPHSNRLVGHGDQVNARGPRHRQAEPDRRHEEDQREQGRVPQRVDATGGDEEE